MCFVICFFLKIWMNDFCCKDLDGDGKMNGEEFGDLDCEWMFNSVFKFIVSFFYFGKLFGVVFNRNSILL